MRLLLARGVDVNAAEKFQQTTALMWAAAEGHVDVVDLLLEAGADPEPAGARHLADRAQERRSSDRRLHGADVGRAQRQRGRWCGGWSTRGANLNLKNGDGASAAMIAIYNDRFDMAATLVELGADVNDGSLYVAVEMRDATTDQFAFDGSRRRPDNPNKLTALDLMKMLLDAAPIRTSAFAGQFHSTSMPNSDRFDNTPFFRAAVAADVEALKLLIAHGANLEQTPPVAAAPDDRTRRRRSAPAGRGRGNPNAGRTAAMVAMTGGRGPGDDRRTRLHPRRRGAVSRAGQPQARRRVRAAARRRARTRTRRGPTAARCCTRRRAPAISR